MPNTTPYPSAPPAPPPVNSSLSGTEITSMKDSVTPDLDDGGINFYCLRLIAMWARVTAYLKTIKHGHMEEPWTPNSTYQQIASDMFQLETSYPAAHRFKTVKFYDRFPADLEKHRDYWAPWIFSQIVYHSVRAVANHPFLHLRKTNGRHRLCPPSFLQHATDQAILHSSWVARILQMCVEKELSILDPFIGHLASVAATICLFLQFSRDPELVSAASGHFEGLKAFLNVQATQHLHLRYVVHLPSSKESSEI
ncbi:uncharacterized protein A1O9_00450 [Exophiala aquamarina CBS 119918]|uniref:Transcription factor domain-containing protein n=1 Tax=Exophiala aquamarina CBS 119918 TaxID=1182545 RepID=A0A072PRT4_9EURO|nr:uncharacterized protein A1O9_00450 [Exophiala aquamarina CBS 119918]KEF62477.1 hypothetical protein A1O9_00450 [Exophiala aquamarina CBS 119918]